MCECSRASRGLGARETFRFGLSCQRSALLTPPARSYLLVSPDAEPAAMQPWALLALLTNSFIIRILWRFGELLRASTEAEREQLRTRSGALGGEPEVPNGGPTPQAPYAPLATTEA